MANILIATLGDSPIVVSAAVKTLKERRGIDFQHLYVIYPQKADLIEQAYSLVHDAIEEFDRKIEVLPVTLPGDDVNTTQDSLQFLRTTVVLLEELGAFSTEKHQIYISFAGGRKNMAALMLFPCQFSESIRSMFHLLDKYEGTPRNNIVPIDDLVYLKEQQQLQRMLPPVENVILIEIDFPRLPYPQQFLEFIKRSDKETAFIRQFETKHVSTDIDPNWIHFSESIFAEGPLAKFLDLFQPQNASSVPGTLIMPLGESPAIVYQTCKLLQRENKQVRKVRVVYPQKNQKIRPCVRWLQAGFQKREIAFETHPVQGLRDVHDMKECLLFKEELFQVIQTEKEQRSDTNIWLSLSGGRKTMTLFSLLAAQSFKIPNVYHTLIIDPDLEETLIEKGKVDKLKRMNDDEREEFLFREDFDPNQFELLQVPLILVK